MSKINRNDFLKEMISGYKEDIAKRVVLSPDEITLETTSKSDVDKIEEMLTANISNNVSRETSTNENNKEEGENNNEDN